MCRGDTAAEIRTGIPLHNATILVLPIAVQHTKHS